MRLSEVARSRDNNFNLIRMLAALGVLVTHSFGMAAGSEPLRGSLGLTWGVIAVNVFFVTSGFLVTASLQARNNAVDFIWARVLRIYPALWVMLGLTVFGLGAALTTHSLGSYLSDRLTWHYFIKNAVLITGVDYLLPGVFETKRAINGSLWTLTPEVRIYLLLLGLWVTAHLAGRRRDAAFRISILATAAISASVYFHIGEFEPPERNFPRLVFMFFTGAAFCMFKEKIVLSRPLFWALVVMLGLSLLNPPGFFYVFSATLPYLLIYTAYAFAGPIRAFNRLGDYSYGVYIYAFPVQQTLAASVPGISVGTLLLYSAVITLGLAALSWHLVEKRALRAKGAFSEKTKLSLRSWRARLRPSPRTP